MDSYKRSTVLFSYSSHYSKVINVSHIFFEVLFVVFAWFLIYRSFWGIYIILIFFRHFQKEVISFLNNILRSIVQVIIFLRCFYNVYLCFLIFQGIYVISNHFQAVKKWNKVIFILSFMIFYGQWCNLKFFDVFFV